MSLKYGIRPAAAYPRRFGYDAVRVPLYLAWGAPRDRARLSALAEAWAGARDQTPAVIDLDTGDAVEPLADGGYRAVAALLRCAAEGAPFPDELRTVQFDRYYPATLHMLCLAALRQRWPSCLRG